MFNFTLYQREMRRSLLTLCIFGALMTLYLSVIIGMFDPKLMGSLDEWVDILPEMMAAIGMTAGATTLIGFMSSYLYGFILLVIPMVFIILRANALVAKYVDSNAMVSLAAAPVKRRAIAFTQMAVLATGMIALVVYATVIELACAAKFPGALAVGDLLRLNLGLLCLHLFIGGICFFASCLFNETKYSIAVGAGVPALMFILKMLSNTGEAAEKAKYFTFFTLFNPDGIVAGEASAIIGMAALFVGACALFAAAIGVFRKKDLHI
ncbi:MAG: ABC transporter permease [Oscillospiraceae bacterium]|jgi:ABC-2 type transport system permease protein|nr:ABC transporter permease [Oscillospiraceae bacterium]